MPASVYNIDRRLLAHLNGASGYAVLSSYQGNLKNADVWIELPEDSSTCQIHDHLQKLNQPATEKLTDQEIKDIGEALKGALSSFEEIDTIREECRHFEFKLGTVSIGLAGLIVLGLIALCVLVPLSIPLVLLAVGITVVVAVVGTAALWGSFSDKTDVGLQTAKEQKKLGQHRETLERVTLRLGTEEPRIVSDRTVTISQDSHIVDDATAHTEPASSAPRTSSPSSLHFLNNVKKNPAGLTDSPSPIENQPPSLIHT